MSNNVVIPDVPRDDRIGSAFNQLFSVIHQTREGGNCVKWDFCNKTFFHPFFLAPLAIYKDSCGKNIVCSNLPNGLKGYLKTVCFEDIYDASNLSNLNTLEGYLGKSYIPISRFTMLDSNIDKIEGILQRIIERQSKIADNMRNPISYFFSELIGNISEHSGSKYGYLFSQKVKKNLYIIIADSGKTIYKSYVDTNKYLSEIDRDEAKAMKIANEGYSTKDRPLAENRGYGISQSRKMIVEGLKGAFFILSGTAFFRHDENGIDIVNIPEQFRWNGTIILVRIPLAAPPEFDFYNYLE